MTRPRAIADEDIEPKSYVRERFEPFLDLEFGVDGTEEAVIEALDGRSVALATSRLPFTRTVIESAPSLELIGKYGTGVDNIDLDAAAANGVTVLHTPGLNAFAVAEFTLTLILAVRRRLLQNQHLLQRGGWRDEVVLSENLIGSTVGIVGYGNIGQHLARLLQGFDTDVFAYDPYVPDPALHRMGVERADLDALLERSDVVSVNAELTDKTRGMIDAEAFRRMKESAVLVNTARGPIVEEDALLDAVERGAIAGAGLDVFGIEPLPSGSPLHDYENIVTTPHVAGTTSQSRRTCIEHLATATETFLDGAVPADQYVAVDATDAP